MSVFSDDAEDDPELETAVHALNDGSSLLMNLRAKHDISLERAVVLVMMAAEMEGGVPVARVMRLAARTFSENAAKAARAAGKRPGGHKFIGRR